MSPDWRSPADLEEYYKDLSAEGNYFQASHSFNRWKNYKLWNGINHKVDTEEWTGESYPNLFNAFYSSSLNFVCNNSLSTKTNLLTFLLCRLKFLLVPFRSHFTVHTTHNT
jgi:hypothetical protein